MKICIVAHNAYGALTGEESGHIGGVERQTSLLALWLVKRGHHVSVITWHEGGDNIETINKIKVIKLCSVTDGLPVLRFLTPRWTSLTRALKEANAELYYHNCAEYVTGQVAFWCKINKRTFIYTVASDADCEIQLPNLKFKREEYLFRYGLKNANLVITQTIKQKKLLQNNYGIDAMVINMPGTPPAYKKKIDPEALFAKQKVIWVGRLHKVKRIEWLIKIAQQLPNVAFEVIGPSDDNSAYIDRVLRDLHNSANITYLGKVSRTNIPDIYQNASLLCNTSIYEGFPNTYLEAWSYGVPVITTIDPDNLIQNNKLGCQGGNCSCIAEQIQDLLGDKEKWLEFSRNCLSYYSSNHDQEKAMQKFEAVFIEQVSKLVKSHFDLQSGEWANFYTEKELSISHLDLQHRLHHAKNILSEIHYSPERAKLLDLGCGTGDVFEYILNSTQWSGFGVDISPEMVSLAKTRYPEFNISVANATQLPFDDNTFSVIISLGVMEYIPAYQAAISEIHRTIKKQGDLIISIPNKDSIFRKLRKFEHFLLLPFKKIKDLMKTKSKQQNNINHQQWSLLFFTTILKEEGLLVQNVNYCTYGFLSPKLAEVKWNLGLSLWLTKKIESNKLLNRWLANTIVIHAKAG